MQKIWKYSFAAIFIVFFSFHTAHAAAISVRPFLIDQTVEARDIITQDITLTNETEGKLNIYATVNEITMDADGEVKEFVSPIMTDRTNTITSWVEVTRGRIELQAGETKTVPLTIRTHPQAQPGEYHAFIGFVPAQKAYKAQEAAMAGNAEGVIVKLTIEDKSEEFLRITSYIINRFVVRDTQRTVTIEVENLGDTPESPDGEIVFFNSLGEEVTAVKVNQDKNVVVPPGETTKLTVPIPFDNELGRYKANLTLQYGTKQRATIYDTAQFFMMPFHIMLIIMTSIVALSFLIVWLLRRAFDEHDDGVDGADIPLYVREGHDPKPKDHDIDLSNKA